MARNFRAPHRLLLAACLLAVLARASVAAVVYVNINCPGPVHDGKSWATAFQSVHEGVDWANLGDELWVAKGVYYEHLHVQDAALYGGFVGTESERALRDWKQNVTVLDGSHSGTVVTTPSDHSSACVIDGFTITNGGGTSVGGVYLPKGGTVSNNLITGNCGSSGGGVYCLEASVRNNVIVRNEASSEGGGCYAGYGSTIENNVIAYNFSLRGGGVYFWSDGPGYHSVIVNNTIVGNRGHNPLPDVYPYPTDSGGIFVGSFLSGGSPLIANNIVAFNTGGIYHDSTNPVTESLRANCVFGNVSDYINRPNSTGENGNISVDPQVCGWPAGDFHLFQGSPCIDAGDDASTAGLAFDLDGMPRIMGAHVDIGALEYPVPKHGTAEATLAARISLGETAITREALDRLNVEMGSGSAGKVDLLDAVRLMRKVAGLEGNP